jgi:glycine/betaine/sarcosine/D-proline reductase family selenoprotein B
MEPNKWRVVCFLNQFFGQIGGEEKADSGFTVFNKPIGPAILINSLLGDEAEVVGTVICGDNYFTENPEAAKEEGLKLTEYFKPDLFFAGPAFNAGRYGLSCGHMASAVSEKMNIPAVTGMAAENPSADIFRRNIYIVETGTHAGEMRKYVPKMVSIGLRCLKGEHIGSAASEGYIIRDRIVNETQEETAAVRAVRMLTKKLRGEPFKSELIPPKFDEIEPAPPVTDLSKIKIAMATDGGMVPIDNPDKIRSHQNTTWGKYNFHELVNQEHFVPHTGYDSTNVMEDYNRLFPYDALLILKEEGTIGDIDDTVYVACGNAASISYGEIFGKEMAQEMLKSGVAAAILTST